MITLLREGTLIIRVYRAWWWAWLPATPVRAGNTDKRKYKNGRDKQFPLGTSKVWTMYTYEYRLVSRQKQDRATSYFTHKIDAFIDKNVNGTKTNIRGKQWSTCTIYILHGYPTNFSLIIQQLINLLKKLTFEMFASSHNCLEQIQQFVSEFCRYTWQHINTKIKYIYVYISFFYNNIQSNHLKCTFT